MRHTFREPDDGDAERYKAMLARIEQLEKDQLTSNQYAELHFVSKEQHKASTEDLISNIFGLGMVLCSHAFTEDFCSEQAGIYKQNTNLAGEIAEQG